MRMSKLSIVVLLTAALGIGWGCEKKADSGGEANEATAEAAPSEEGEASDQAADESGDESAEAAKEADDSEESEKKKEQAQLPEDMESGETETFGDDFKIDEEPIELASAIEELDASKPTEGQEEVEAGPYKVSATIEKVCKKKGCWFTLQGEDVERPIRVRMKDYGFFVPRNTDGGDAVVEGTLTRRMMSEKEAKHYAEDEGKDPSEVTKEDRDVYEFTASTVKIAL